MFAHTGKTRTTNHNLGIASLLSFVAGLVNVVGFFSVAKLTTNVTGHFAFFVDEAFRMNYITALHVALYVFFFFLGAFISNIMVETLSRISENYTYIFPVLLEAAILAIIALGGQVFIKSNPDIIAFSLLFAMGLQNSLVTTISNSVVRTTHLTGLFTDMGIEFSQLFFLQKPRTEKSTPKIDKAASYHYLDVFCRWYRGRIAVRKFRDQKFDGRSFTFIGGFTF